MKTFKDALKSARRKAGVSQAGASALIPHLSVRTLQEWESGRQEPPLWAQELVLEALRK